MTSPPLTALGGPAQLVLTASVARRYYLDGKSKIEIAEEFRLSRFKVARLLELARTSGLVRIDIANLGPIDVTLSGELCDAYGLNHASVVDTLDDEPRALRRLVGRSAAQLLTEIVVADDVLGLGWDNSLMTMRGELTRLAACSVVQLTGAGSRPAGNNSIGLVRDIARVARGPAYSFDAPIVAPNAAAAAALLRHPDVAAAASRFTAITKAVVGVGTWRPADSLVHDATAAFERTSPEHVGICADVSGVLLDAEGGCVATALTARVIGIRAAELRRIPEVIGLCYGPADKAAAARAAIAGGYVSSVVTHVSFARALLAAARSGSARPAACLT